MGCELQANSSIDRFIQNSTRKARRAILFLQQCQAALTEKLLDLGDWLKALFGIRPEVPMLPQDTRDPQARAQQLAESRKQWRYQSPAFLPPLSNVDGKPPGEELSGAYFAQMLPVLLDMAANQVQSCHKFFEDNPQVEPDLKALPAYIEQASGSVGPTTLLKNMMVSLLDGKVPRPRTLASYDKIYQTIPRPSLAASYQDDLAFAYQRIGGGNNTIIQRVAAVPDTLPVTDTLFQKVCGVEGTTLEAAAKEGRLYLCDYRILDGIPAGEVFGMAKSVTAPLALFYLQPGGTEGGVLRPIAIQLGQRPDSEQTPVFTPLDGIKWSIAKAFVQNADGIQLQTIAHLQHCHLTIEPLIVPTMRQLASNHPVQVLLKPHFRFTVPINFESRSSLITAGGVVDSILSPQLEQGTYEIVKRAFSQWRFDAAMPEAVFKARGVDDPAVLPCFPFRDDTLLLWKAIQTFVGSYLEIYYPTDQAVVLDTELQAWMREIRSADGPHLPGFEPFLDASGQLSSREELAKILSYIVYLAGPQHSSVNYSMYAYEGYIPSCPLSMWGPPPTAHSAEDESSFALRLPPLDIALYQSQFAFLLATQKYDTFGHYAPRTFTDPRVQPLISRLQGELRRIEEVIAQRNSLRRYRYELQLPSRITNSISI